MNRFKIGKWEIVYDKNATSEFYADYHSITEDCDCVYCKNYVNAVEELPRELLELFNIFGIDPAKEAEVYQCKQNKDGSHLYGGFYHIVGEIIKGSDCWIEDNEGIKSDDGFISFEGYSVGFSKDIALVPDSFPSPVIQLEFQVNVPWRI